MQSLKSHVYIYWACSLRDFDTPPPQQYLHMHHLHTPPPPPHTHTQKSIFFLPTPTEVALYAAILYPTPQAIYMVQKATLSNNFL